MTPFLSVAGPNRGHIMKPDPEGTLNNTMTSRWNVTSLEYIAEQEKEGEIEYSNQLCTI